MSEKRLGDKTLPEITTHDVISVLLIVGTFFLTGLALVTGHVGEAAIALAVLTHSALEK